ncbi:MAG: hypothetical protein WCA56_14045 [Xanthobacteraceae bacterium]
MTKGWISRAVWKSALRFALVGPLVGLFIGFCLVLANIGRLFVLGRAREIAPPDGSSAYILPALLLFIPAILAAVYVVGAPGGFAAGAAMQIMRERSFAAVWIVAANALIGFAVSFLTFYMLDEYILPHPHLDPAPQFGPSMCVAIGAVGALSAIICTLVKCRQIIDTAGGAAPGPSH